MNRWKTENEEFKRKLDALCQIERNWDSYNGAEAVGLVALQASYLDLGEVMTACGRAQEHPENPYLVTQVRRQVAFALERARNQSILSNAIS